MREARPTLPPMEPLGQQTRISTNLLRASSLILLEWREKPGRPLIAGGDDLIARVQGTPGPSTEHSLDALLSAEGRAKLDELLGDAVTAGPQGGIVRAGRIPCLEAGSGAEGSQVPPQVWLDLTIEWSVVGAGAIECAAAAIDVSHTVAVEQVRTRQAKRLEFVIEGTRLGIWDWDLSSGAVTINRYWMEMLGEPFITPHIGVEEWSSRVHPDDLERTIADVQAAIEGKTPFYENVHRLRHANGSWVHVLDRGMVVERDEEGNVIRFSGTHTDITAQKEAEIAAQDAARSKNVFLATMSHEIRTPLHGILGMLQVLEGTRLDREQLEALNLASMSGEHLLVLINDILEISRIESGEFHLDPQPFELAGWLGTIAELFRGGAEEKRLELTIALAPRRSTWLRADDHRLRQVLGNLISNAIKFTEAGGVRVEAEPGEGRLVVRVIDSGKGIADTSRIWNIFSQEDATVSRDHGGTGLGLSLCREIITAMGGEIRVESTVGEGSVFEFWIPVERIDAPEDAAGPKSADPIDSISELEVLVAEDNPVNRRVAKGIFKRVGLEIEFAEDGQQAVEMCREKRFDVVFIDLHMPRLDGFDAAQEILREQGVDAPRLVALTADLTDEARERCDAIGIHGHLGKPFRQRELERALYESLTERGSFRATLAAECVQDR